MKSEKGLPDRLAPLPASRLGGRSGQAGQTILMLILVMTVTLAIGLSVVQRSLVDVSTSTKVEQSSRAFSAAEAGIERALNVGATPPFTLPESGAEVEVKDLGLIPAVAASGARQSPLEYPPLAKEEVAHVWLADPAANLPSCAAPNVCYSRPDLDVYWGSSTTDQAALELTLVYHNGTQYVSRKWYLDRVVRNPANNFNLGCGPTGGSSLQNYTCKFTIGSLPDPALPAGLMLLRARLLYNTASQPFAVQAVGTCGVACSLPPQARDITSTGVAGQTQRKVQLFQVNKVVPPYFDYAIFSAGDITK